MKRHITTLLLIILTGIFISCEKDIKFKGKITDPLLVMNGLLSPDSVVSIHLSQSRFILGDVVPFTHVSGAMVSVFVNGQLKEQITNDAKGLYTGTYFPKPGDEIKIEVKADGFDVVRAQTVIPQSLNLIVNDSTVTLQGSESTYPNQPNTLFKTRRRNMQAQLKLTDAEDEENYYYIKGTQNYYRKNQLVMNKFVYFKLSEVLKSNITDSENIFEDILGDGMTNDRTENLFSDLYVNGKEILFDFSFDDTLESSKYVNGEKVDSPQDDELIVEYIIEIGEFSKDFNQYVISGNKAANSEDAGFSEPIQVHTNIENGIGILGAYNSYRFISRFHSNYFPFYTPTYPW